MSLPLAGPNLVRSADRQAVLHALVLHLTGAGPALPPVLRPESRAAAEALLAELRPWIMHTSYRLPDGTVGFTDAVLPELDRWCCAYVLLEALLT